MDKVTVPIVYNNGKLVVVDVLADVFDCKHHNLPAFFVFRGSFAIVNQEPKKANEVKQNWHEQAWVDMLALFLKLLILENWELHY